MECDDRTLLLQRLHDEGFQIEFDPPGDGMCFYASAGHQINRSASAVQNDIFLFLQNHRYDVDGNDKLEFICSVDVGKEVPKTWDGALNLLKDNYANELIVMTFPDVFQYTVEVITVYGSDNYIKVYEPKEGPSNGTLYFGHSGSHYVALKRILEIESVIMAGQYNVTESMTNDTAQSADDIEEVVHSMASQSLDENGQRNWQEESKMYLDDNFSDWKNPQSTRMVPPMFHSKPGQATGDEAEEKIFNLIEKFGQVNAEPMFVVHSYDFVALIENAEKGYCSRELVKGECDFVIIHRHFGLVFIEVKAKDTTRKDYDIGLKQLEKVRKAVVWYSLKIFKDNNLKKKSTMKNEMFKHHGFVAMPNCSRQESYHSGIFKEDCQDVDAFKKWWDHNVVRTDRGISQEVYEALTTRLVPIHYVAPTLNIQIERTHEIITTRIPKQLEIMLHSCPKQWITGPAGSGKTVLLLQKVKEVISSIVTNEDRKQERVLVLCFNRPLCVYLRNEIKNWKFETSSTPVKIETYDSFMMKVFRLYCGISTSVPSKKDGKPNFKKIKTFVENSYKCQSPPDEAKYDHIFVDEGQDFRQEWLELLVKFHKQHDMTQKQQYQSYFWVMFDSNQHVQFSRALLPWKNLNQASRLTSILRNTEKIFLESKKHFDGLFNEDIKLGHKEVGLNVKFDGALLEDKSNGVEVLCKHIDLLLSEKVEKKDVIILTREIKARDDLITNLSKKYSSKIENGERRLESRNDVIAVESIRRFKGLQSKVVIVYDPEYSTPTNKNLISKARELLYIAMSRCFCYLVIVSTEERCHDIQSGKLNVPYEVVLQERKKERKKEVRPSTELMDNIEDRKTPLDQAPSEMKVPGPIQEKPKCQQCSRTIARNHRDVVCCQCSFPYHIKCGGVTPKQYDTLTAAYAYSWTCKRCSQGAVTDLLHPGP